MLVPARAGRWRRGVRNVLMVLGHLLVVVFMVASVVKVYTGAEVTGMLLMITGWCISNYLEIKALRRTIEDGR